MVAALAQLLVDAPEPQRERPKLTLVPPPKPDIYEMAHRAWVSTVLGALRGYCVYADESGCEVHGQGAGLAIGEPVIIKIEPRRGEMLTAKARVVECSHSRAFFRFEDLPVDTWDALSTLR